MSTTLLTIDTDLISIADAIRHETGINRPLVYPEDFILGIRSFSASSATGNSSISISDATAGEVCSLTQYGVCEQDSSTNAISCNNGTLSISGGEIVVTAANEETLTVGAQTATVENLYSVESVRDEQEITTGRIIRRNNVCIYDGTQPVGSRYLSSTGTKENGAIIVYPLEDEYSDDSLVSFVESSRKELNKLEVGFRPTQSFNGYGHPWPGGEGVNLFGVNDATNIASGSNRILSVSNELLTVAASGAVSSTAIITSAGMSSVIRNASLPAGTYYFNIFNFSATVSGASSSKIRLNINNNGTTIAVAPGSSFTVTNGSIASVAHTSSLNWSKNQSISFRFCISAANVSEWTPYENVCPISGKTSTNAYVSQTQNVSDAAVYSADWSTQVGAVYAGKVDISSGKLKACPYYSSYNGETLVGPWISSMDVYSSGNTPTIGAQVVDIGGSETVYQIDKKDALTFIGQNYVWGSDGVSVDVAVSNPIIQRATPQPLTLASGNNTISATNLSVSSVPLKLEYNN